MQNIDYLFEIVEENKIEELINCEIQNINIVDEFGYNLLMVAIVNEANETSKYLIEMGINLDFQDSEGKSILHYLAHYPNVNILSLIKGKELKTNLKDKHGNTALWAAILNANGNYEYIQFLIEHGANPESLNKVNRSPKWLANDIGSKKIIEILNN